jgi:hypothetical protein
MKHAAQLVSFIVLVAFLACGGPQKMTPSSGPPDQRRTYTDGHKEKPKKNTAPPPAYGHKVARECELVQTGCRSYGAQQP